jgi:hypothetical protein
MQKFWYHNIYKICIFKFRVWRFGAGVVVQQPPLDALLAPTISISLINEKFQFPDYYNFLRKNAENEI